tara:strand:- start:28532 stop:30232 length:1701 start_codon:yes stop_codon:yes gene_type:complete
VRILLVVPNYQEKFYQIPRGLMCISAYLKDKGYDVTCLNLNHYDSGKLTNVLRKNSFEIVATGEVFTRFKPIKEIIETTRICNPDAKIVIGGGIATGDPEFILNELRPDYLVLGEGEVAMDNLAQAIKNRSDIHDVTGVAFKENGTFIKTKPTPLIEDLDQLPYPDYEGFEYAFYMQNFISKSQHLQTIMDISKRRLGIVNASRDCVKKCTFCFRIMGGNFRTRSIKNFFGEISYLIDKYGITDLLLQDDILASNKKRIFEFCEAIKPLNLFWSCNLRVSNADDDIYEAMKDAGCYNILYGFESASPAVLKSMKKGITPKLMEKAIQASLKAKLRIDSTFIFGDPVETLQTINETFKFIYNYKSIRMGMKLISPFAGTVYYEIYKKRYGIEHLPNFYKNHLMPINITSLSKKEFSYMVRKVDFENSYHLLYSMGKILNSKKIAKRIFNLDILCPNCKLENDNCRIDFNEGFRLVCKHCLQTIYINQANFRFGNISQIYQFLFLYVKKIVLYNVYTYRLLFFILPLIENTAAVCRAVVNFIQKRNIGLNRPADDTCKKSRMSGSYVG